MALHSLYMKSGDGFVLVFSLTSMESVNELQSIREQIHRIKEAEHGRVSSPALFPSPPLIPRDRRTSPSSWSATSATSFWSGKFRAKWLLAFRAHGEECPTTRLRRGRRSTFRRCISIPFPLRCGVDELKQVFEDVLRQMVKAGAGNPQRSEARKKQRKCVVF